MEEAFLLGVIDVVAVENSDDLVVVGNGKGRAMKGNAVYVSNPGVDDAVTSLTVIKEVNFAKDKQWMLADGAENCVMGLRIEHGTSLNIRRGSVVYTREAKAQDIQDTYISALGDGYIVKDKLDIKDEILNNLTVTDLAEVWRLNGWFHANVIKNETEEEKKLNTERLNKLCAVLCKKLLDLDSFYVVSSKATGEPYMFSRTARKDQGFLCTPPNIRIIPKAYFSLYVNSYPNDKFEFRIVENGEDKKGIYNFFCDCFFLNGAQGVEVITENTAIGGPALVKAPNFTGMPASKIPVMNPDTTRWLLMLGQMGAPETEDEKLIQNLYFGFLSQELPKARLLVPMKTDVKPDEKGEINIKKGDALSIATRPGRADRPVVRMFTDWKRLRAQHSSEWGGLNETVAGMINEFDVSLNPSSYTRSGVYISKELFEEMKETAKTIEEMKKQNEK